ncbi:hypothetical protein [Neptunomonas sp. XY-337]|uniref:type II secretion system protein GspD n=1 Tax=Neptunomonas sp. XY-337 TaxID=2561897 RepID=UPI0010AB4EB9|nr:hypothetical protein [Neptunomonas sp. XY-337]
MIKKIISCLVMSSLLATSLPTAAKTRIKRVEFKEANIRDTARILATLSGANIAVTKEASGASVDLLLQNVDVKHAVEMISRVSGLWYRYNKANNSYLIMTEKQYQDDIVVYRDDIIKSFTLKHQNVTATALTIQSLYGDRVILKLQKDLDDFSGIPSNYLETIQDLTSTSGKSNDNRVTVNNVNSNNRDSNASYAAQNNGSVNTPQDLEATKALIHQEVDNSQLSTTQLKQIQNNGSEQLDADAQGRKLGIKTPIFIATNKIHNLMFVRTSDERALAEIEDLIQESDKPTPQVLLETKILRITEGDAYTQDFDFSYNSALNVPGASYDDGTKITDILAGNATVKLEDMSVNNVNRVIQQYLDNSVRQAGFDAVTGGFYQYYSKFVNAKIELLEETNRAEVIAKPILLASNNRPSRLFIGEDQVIATSLDGGSTTTTNTGNTSTTSTTKTELETEVRKVGNTLALLPSVNEDGTVTIDILQSTSELKKQGMEFPFYNERTSEIDSVLLDTIEESTLKTIVVAKDGLTIALGGMINKVDKSERSTVPVLGDIPILGQMFQGKKDVESDAQYIMLITPHIITNPHDAKAKTEEIEELDYGRFSESTRAAEQALIQQEQVPERLDYITQAHAKPSSGLASAPVPASTLIRLNRHAARFLNGKSALDEDIHQRSQRVTDLSRLSSNALLSVRTNALFELEGIYLTVLEVTNQSSSSQVLPIDLIQGDWLSVSRTEKALAPFKAGSKRTGYLLIASKAPILTSVFEK